MPMSPGEIATSTYSCRHEYIQQKSQVGTRTPHFPSRIAGRFHPRRKVANPFASYIVPHYWTVSQEPYNIIMTPITDFFLGNTKLPLS